MIKLISRTLFAIAITIFFYQSAYTMPAATSAQQLFLTNFSHLGESYFKARFLQDNAALFEGITKKINFVTTTFQGQQRMISHLTTLPATAQYPEGLLISRSHDNTIKMWDIATNTCVRSFIGHQNFVSQITTLPPYLPQYPMGLLISCSQDTTARVWDIATGTCLHVLQAHTRPTHRLASLPPCPQYPAGLVATAGDDNVAYVWNPLTGRQVSVLQGHTGLISDIIFIPSRTLHALGLIATVSYDQTAKIWDPFTGACIHTLQHQAWVTALTYLSSSPQYPNGLIITGSYNGMVGIWDPSSGNNLYLIRGNGLSVSNIALLHGNLVATASANAPGIDIWNPYTGTRLFALTGHTQGTSVLTALPASPLYPRGLLASSSWDNTIKLWDLGTGNCVYTTETSASTSPELWSMITLPATTQHPYPRLAGGFYWGAIKIFTCAEELWNQVSFNQLLLLHELESAAHYRPATQTITSSTRQKAKEKQILFNKLPAPLRMCFNPRFVFSPRRWTYTHQPRQTHTFKRRNARSHR